MCTRSVPLLELAYLCKKTYHAELTTGQKFNSPEGISKRAMATIDFYKGIKVRSPINRAFCSIPKGSFNRICLRAPGEGLAKMDGHTKLTIDVSVDRVR
jgi:hypothetical protein